MTAKRGLGKGLDMLIPTAPQKIKEKNGSSVEEKETNATTEIREIIKEVEVVKEVAKEIKLDINEVEPNRDQPRRQFDEDALLELADSIRQVGIIQPIVVQKRMDIMKLLQENGDGEQGKLQG